MVCLPALKLSGDHAIACLVATFCVRFLGRRALAHSKLRKCVIAKSTKSFRLQTFSNSPDFMLAFFLLLLLGS